MKRREWIPEVMYEDDSMGAAPQLPFIQVPPEEEMPKFLLIYEYKDTGEVEPGPDGSDCPIVQPTLRQYAMMDTLKENLSVEDYDKVRIALGLQPMAVATKKGKEITARVLEKVGK